jgi:hypothetical protein
VSVYVSVWCERAFSVFNVRCVYHVSIRARVKMQERLGSSQRELEGKVEWVCCAARKHTAAGVIGRSDVSC